MLPGAGGETVAGERRDAGLAQWLRHVVCLTWLSGDVMFSEKVRFFCYNTAPEGKPTASSGAPIDSTAILSSAGENLATLDLVRHDVGCVGLQGRAFLRCVPCCAGYTPTFVFVMKIGDFIVFHSESRT